MNSPSTSQKTLNSNPHITTFQTRKQTSFCKELIAIFYHLTINIKSREKNYRAGTKKCRSINTTRVARDRFKIEYFSVLLKIVVIMTDLKFN